jgi:hypothetical protein
LSCLNFESARLNDAWCSLLMERLARNPTVLVEYSYERLEDLLKECLRIIVIEQKQNPFSMAHRPQSRMYRPIGMLLAANKRNPGE